jgi:hypothetical protein
MPCGEAWFSFAVNMIKMIKLLIIGFTFVCGMVLVGNPTSPAKDAENETALIDVLNYNGNIGQKDVDVTIEVYGTGNDSEIIQRVSGNLVYDGQEHEVNFNGTYNTETGEIVMKTAEGKVIRGTYDEGLCDIEGTVSDKNQLLAFNWQL